MDNKTNSVSSFITHEPNVWEEIQELWLCDLCLFKCYSISFIVFIISLSEFKDCGAVSKYSVQTIDDATDCRSFEIGSFNSYWSSYDSNFVFVKQNGFHQTLCSQFSKKSFSCQCRSNMLIKGRKMQLTMLEMKLFNMQQSCFLNHWEF